jgi:hypothetical protein
MSLAFHLRLRDEPEAAALARRAVAATLAEMEAIDVDLVSLVVTELVGRLAGASGDVTVDVHVDVTAARVRVHVTGPGRARETPPERTVSAGWSLLMMERTVDRWGIEDGPPTRVWFEIDRPVTDPGDPTSGRRSPSAAR